MKKETEASSKNNFCLRIAKGKGSKMLVFTTLAGVSLIDMERHVDEMAHDETWTISLWEGQVFIGLMKAAIARDAAHFLAIAREASSNLAFIRVTDEMKSGPGWADFREAVEAAGLKLRAPLGRCEQVPVVTPLWRKAENYFSLPKLSPRPTRRVLEVVRG